MTMIDKGTGLPRLPEGMFWRITKPNIINHHEVQLRKKRLIGSKLLEYSQVARSDMNAATIRWNAGYALRLYQGRNQGAPFVGTYPPKKLED